MQFQEFIKTYNEIIKAYNKIYHEFAVEIGIGDSALTILYELRVGDGYTTQRDLGGLLSLSKQTVNSSIKVLADRGMIELQDSSIDKRKKVITLTDKGKQFCAENIDKIINAEKCAFDRLSDAERITLVSAEKKYYQFFYEESSKVKGNKDE